VGRHDLQNEAKPEENPAAPPADGRQKISSLSNADKGVGRRARSAEIGGESSALPTLKQDRQNEDYAVENEQRQKKRVNH
jgi:hypothetical protein